MARWVAYPVLGRVRCFASRAEKSGDHSRAKPQVSRGSHLPLRAGIGATRRCAGWPVRRAGTACRPALGTLPGGRRPHARSSAARADPDPVRVPAPPAHQMASQAMRFLPLGPNSALAAPDWFPLVATRCQPLKRRGIRLVPLRDHGGVGSDPVLPIQSFVSLKPEVASGNACRNLFEVLKNEARATPMPQVTSHP